MYKYYFFISIIYVLSLKTYALPSPSHDDAQKLPVKQETTSSFPPLLEFKNGGIRVNFAGYHAEAGLGGLFGGTGTRGGLFAGAGTPFGAHASANVGGVVEGEDGGSTGGGLHARAGLGNGGPEAAAGLGGALNGANGGGNRGRIYAATKNGGKTRIASKEIGPGQSNIQMIPKLIVQTDSSIQNPEIKGDVTRRDILTPEGGNPQVAGPTRRCEKKRRRVCHNHGKKVVIYQQTADGQKPRDFAFEKPIPNAGFDGPILGEKNHETIPGLGPAFADATGLKEIPPTTTKTGGHISS